MTKQTDYNTSTPTIRPEGPKTPNMVENEMVLTNDEWKVLMKSDVKNDEKFSDVTKKNAEKNDSQIMNDEVIVSGNVNVMNDDSVNIRFSDGECNDNGDIEMTSKNDFEMDKKNKLSMNKLNGLIVHKQNDAVMDLMLKTEIASLKQSAIVRAVPTAKVDVKPTSSRGSQGQIKLSELGGIPPLKEEDTTITVWIIKLDRVLRSIGRLPDMPAFNMSAFPTLEMDITTSYKDVLAASFNLQHVEVQKVFWTSKLKVAKNVSVLIDCLTSYKKLCEAFAHVNEQVSPSSMQYKYMVKTMISSRYADLLTTFTCSESQTEENTRYQKFLNYLRLLLPEKINKDEATLISSKLKNPKADKLCFFCKKPGHFKKECRKFLVCRCITLVKQFCSKRKRKQLRILSRNLKKAISVTTEK